jgi:S-adenosylmethionine-diacylglycerol 3-amino-3-carboxypropyl transferase
MFVGLVEKASKRYFNWVHQNHLVYNICWEDPRLDRQAMKLGAEDEVLVITSAGCNALDYALDSPRRIYAVDVNPRQNALLDLKIAGIRELEYEDFFQIFGEGSHRFFSGLYRNRMRKHLRPASREFWDKNEILFHRESFYLEGTSGYFARFIRFYIDCKRLRSHIHELFDSHSVEEQKEIYQKLIKNKFWSRALRAFLGSDLSLALLGVPRAQRKVLEAQYPSGIAQFMQENLENALTRLPIQDNYFWWLYFHGSFTKKRAPLYLQQPHFNELKAGKVDVISTHTDTVEMFLRNHEVSISKFVLLDHMDWLATHQIEALRSEWDVMLERARPQANFLWRSGGFVNGILDPLELRLPQCGSTVALKDILQYDRPLADELHLKDRVHTYASFSIARLAA